VYIKVMKFVTEVNPIKIFTPSTGRRAWAVAEGQ
jgi:hypothetical protein